MRRHFPFSFLFGLAVIVVFFCLAPLAHCQVDIIVPRSDQPYIPIARGAQWGISGGGSGDCSIVQCGINNNFIFNALYPQESITVYIFNNSLVTNQSGVVVNAEANNDPAVRFINGNAGKWSSPISLSAGATINSLTSVSFVFQVSGASRVALLISGGVIAGDTLGGDIVVVQSPVAGPSSSLISSTVGTQVNGLFPANTSNAVSGALNPLVAGCKNAPSGISAGRNQFLNCGTDGSLNVIFPSPQLVTFSATLADPCKNPNILPSSVVINISTTTTTQLVAPSGTTQVFVCGFDFTISEVMTTANTLSFNTGTGATCGGSTVTKTGLYGAGGVVAAAPIHIQSGGNGTIFSAAASSGVCAVSTIGASGSFQGIMTFVQ